MNKRNGIKRFPKKKNSAIYRQNIKRIPIKGKVHIYRHYTNQGDARWVAREINSYKKINWKLEGKTPLSIRRQQDNITINLKVMNGFSWGKTGFSRCVL
jgi:superfamily I DNA/RNA helicase